MSQSPPADHAAVGEDGRKRVAKACDRCRLKKIKCDGKSPCSRCGPESWVCTFGERKKSTDRRVPPGYAEYLEDSHKVFVEAVKQLWTQASQAHAMLNAGASEQRRQNQQLPQQQPPPVHVILQQMGLLASSPRSFSAALDLDCAMDAPEEILAQFERRFSDELSRASSCSADSPVKTTALPVRQNNSKGGLVNTSFAAANPNEVDPDAEDSSISPTDIVSGPGASHGQMLEYQRVLAGIMGTSAASQDHKATQQSIPTPQPSADFTDMMWNNSNSYFGIAAQEFNPQYDNADMIMAQYYNPSDPSRALTDPEYDMKWISS